MENNSYEELKMLVNTVSDNPNRYYPTTKGKELLKRLKVLGMARESLYQLIYPLRFEYEDDSIQQEFVDDMLDIISGYYSGMNIDW